MQPQNQNGVNFAEFYSNKIIKLGKNKDNARKIASWIELKETHVFLEYTIAKVATFFKDLLYAFKMQWNN